ncbi:MAG: hypothetical protein ACYCT2_04000 [Thermoplasmataceae archaeon]
MESMMHDELRHFEEVYDNTGTEKAPTFLELIGIFSTHVKNEEDLVVPLLDYLSARTDGAVSGYRDLEQVAEEFSSRYKDMEEEHEEARRAVHRLAELSKATRNNRAYRIWTSIENHVKLETSALRLAESGARSILLKR